jgi:hypothetical protein
MALFNWFSGKSKRAKAHEAANGNRPARLGHPAPTSHSQPQEAPPKPVADPTNRGEERKAKRHARREQLYVAVREAMTRAGVLSASYKFKVLSLDQRGDQFLVMMDVHLGLSGQIDKLAESEATIVQIAKTRFDMTVTSVYWRLDTKPNVADGKATGFEPRLAQLQTQPLSPAARQYPALRFEPIQDDEVAAFKQALSVSAANHPTAPDANGKTRSGLRSYTLITGFEDTEMPESAAAPALSATQYGELR